MRMLAVLAAGLLLAGALATVARADGDPASDYLIAQKVFFPYDAKIPKPAQQKLLSTVQSATRQGFPIRVALIWTDYDLGAVTALWKQPRRYARFLGVELGYYFKGRLLIVMPSGFGFNWPKHDTAAAYRELAGVTIEPTPEGLATAAATAVQRLAAQAGVQASTTQAATGTSSQSNAHDRIVILVAVLAALAIGAAARLVIRRRAARLS
jgi:hypothetical protein